MTNLKEAMKKAKKTGKPQKVEAVTGSKDTSEVKVNISIRLDLEVLNWLKEQTARKGLPYQTFSRKIY